MIRIEFNLTSRLYCVGDGICLNLESIMSLQASVVGLSADHFAYSCKFVNSFLLPILQVECLWNLVAE